MGMEQYPMDARLLRHCEGADEPEWRHLRFYKKGM